MDCALSLSLGAEDRPKDRSTRVRSWWTCSERTRSYWNRGDVSASGASTTDDQFNAERAPSCQTVSMIDHLTIQCANVHASAAFYDAVLAPIRGERVADFGEVIGFGVAPKPDFWIGPLTIGEGFRESHIAFTASDRAAVEAFFEAAVGTGAEILHAPRLWPEYHPNYFGAFVRDPDGNNVEAVCHAPR
jgi:catechol 2,3-dioxygenase-like lactoylglutathione lyase family enzyme